MKYQDIIQQIDNKVFSPVYFLMGEETFYIDKISEHISKNILSEEEKEFNQTTLYGKDIDVSTIISEAKQFPFGSEYRVVIVKEAQDIRTIEKLESYLDLPSPSTILVICYKYKKIDEPSDVEKIRNIGNQALTPEEILLRAIMNANDSFVIGEAYMYSKIILRDPLEAIKYYKDAAEYDDRKGIEQGGNDEAKYKLGVLYYEENSVKDYTESKYWINKAYEGTDTEICKKAEDFWNKHELWNY